MSQLTLHRRLVSESRDVLAERARSFRWAAAFLPRRRHDEAAILYAFCRAVDDAADESADRATATRALRRLEDALRTEQDDRTVAGAVRALITRGEVPESAALQLIEGARGDLSRVRVSDDGELLRYAYRVAGTVGLMMCSVLGVDDPRAFPHAIDLGIAMQLTNICRDVLEDAERGRVYLPATRLCAAGTSQEALISGTADRRAVARVVCDLLELAEVYYASADAGLRYIPRRARLAILVASRLYRAIGLALASQGGDALRGRTVVPWYQKLAWSVRALATFPMLTWRSRYLLPHQTALHAPLAELSHAVS